MRIITSAIALAALIQPIEAQTVTSVMLSEPVPMDGIAMTSEGTILAAGTYRGETLYEIDTEGNATLIATGLQGPIQAVRVSGSIYVTNFRSGTVSRVLVDGTVEAFAEVGSGAAGIVAGPDGALYVSLWGARLGDAGSVVRVDMAGEVTEYASGSPLSNPVGLQFDSRGNLYAGNNNQDGGIVRIKPDGTMEVVTHLPGAVGHLAIHNDRLFATCSDKRIYEVTTGGEISIVAGSGATGRDDGPAAGASFLAPNGIAVSSSGDALYVSAARRGTPDDRLRRISIAGS